MNNIVPKGWNPNERTRRWVASKLGELVPIFLEKWHKRLEWPTARQTEKAEALATKWRNQLDRGGACLQTAATAHAIRELAEALAVLAFRPDGVTFLGQPWQVPPENCEPLYDQV